MSRDQQARFFGKFARLLGAGIPLLRAFEVAADGVTEVGLRAALSRALGRAYDGSSLFDALNAEQGLFAAEVLCLVGEGEKAGDIEKKTAAISEGLLPGDFAAGVGGGGPARGEAGLFEILRRAAEAGAGVVHVGPGAVALRVGRELSPIEVPAAPAELLDVLRRRGERFREGGFRVRSRIEESAEGPVAVLRLLPLDGRSLAAAGLGPEVSSEVEGWLRRDSGVVLAAGFLPRGVEALLEGMVSRISRGRRLVVTASAADLPGVLVAPSADLFALDADVVVLGPGATEGDVERSLRAALDGALCLVGLSAPDAGEALRLARGIAKTSTEAVLLGAVSGPAGPGEQARIARVGGG
jgi:hypothetical protein